MKTTQVARLLAYVTGMVNQQLLLQNEYLLAENGTLRAHLPNRLVLTDAERSTLAVIGKRLGRRGLEPVASAGADARSLALAVIFGAVFAQCAHQSFCPDC
jgi:putative transposase